MYPFCCSRPVRAQIRAHQASKSRLAATSAAGAAPLPRRQDAAPRRLPAEDPGAPSRRRSRASTPGETAGRASAPSRTPPGRRASARSLPPRPAAGAGRSGSAATARPGPDRGRRSRPPASRPGPAPLGERRHRRRLPEPGRRSKARARVPLRRARRRGNRSRHRPTRERRPRPACAPSRAWRSSGTSLGSADSCSRQVACVTARSRARPATARGSLPGRRRRAGGSSPGYRCSPGRRIAARAAA